jgi:hypothetical protein
MTRRKEETHKHPREEERKARRGTQA